MSLQAASLGRFWLGPQTAKGTAATTYYGFKANVIENSPIQLTRNVGQLVGGNLLPGDSVKTAAWSGGSVVMPPPLDDYIGWLFYAFAGSVSTITNGDSTYTHVFPDGADDTAPEKYLTARRSIPGASVLYEQMQDQVVSRLQFGFTPGEFATLRAELMGLEPSNPDGSGWSFSAKGQSSIPVSCLGSFEMPEGTAVSTSTAVTLDMVNITPGPQDVLVVGSYWPVDFPVLGRAITITMTHLWETKDLYSSMWYSGGSWTPAIYSSSVDVTVQSPGYITGSIPYTLKFYAQNVQWEANPVPLRGGDLVRMEMRGIMADAESGDDWTLQLQNGTASYTWPS